MDKTYAFQVWKAANKRWPVGREQVEAVIAAMQDLRDKQEAVKRLTAKRRG